MMLPSNRWWDVEIPPVIWSWPPNPFLPHMLCESLPGRIPTSCCWSGRSTDDPTTSEPGVSISRWCNRCMAISWRNTSPMRLGILGVGCEQNWRLHMMFSWFHKVKTRKKGMMKAMKLSKFGILIWMCQLLTYFLSTNPTNKSGWTGCNHLVGSEKFWGCIRSMPTPNSSFTT